MTILLSLTAAAFFGSSDFIGGLAGKRLSVIQILATAHLVGFFMMLGLALVIPDSFAWVDMGWGVLAGASGAVGLGLLYRGLALGPMGVVGALAAVTSTATPVLWGITVNGERLAALSWVGAALALVAVVLVSSAGSDGIKVSSKAVGFALGAGLGFAGFFINADQTSAETAPWALVAARAFTTTAAIVWLKAWGSKVFPARRQDFWLLVFGGLLDAGSNALVLWAILIGDLSVVTVLTALYPISTVILARLILGERLGRAQQLGFVAAMVATALIAAG